MSSILNAVLDFFAANPSYPYFLGGLVLAILAGRSYAGFSWFVGMIVSALLIATGLNYHSFNLPVSLALTYGLILIGFGMGNGRKLLWFLPKRSETEYE